jgi:hypothetical protein
VQALKIGVVGAIALVLGLSSPGEGCKPKVGAKRLEAALRIDSRADGASMT